MKGEDVLSKNKLILLIATVVSVIILTIGGLTFNAMYKNHQANQLIIEKCYEHFDKVGQVVIKKDGNPITCEKN